MNTILRLMIFYLFVFSNFIYSQTSNWKVLNNKNTGIQLNSYAPIKMNDIDLLFLTDSGQLMKYDGLVKNVHFKIPGIPSNSIKKIVKDKFNNIWFLTYGYGLVKYDHYNFIIFNNLNSGLTDNNINDISFDLFNNLWVATNDGGLFKYDGNNWYRFWTGNSGIPDNQITTLYIDNFNRKWVGTKFPAQVAFYNDTSWVIFNRTNSGIDGQVFKIISDDFNQIWIATGLGISKYNGTSFQHFFM